MIKCICCGVEYKYNHNVDPYWMKDFHDEQCMKIVQISRDFFDDNIDEKQAKAKLAKLGIVAKDQVPALLPKFAAAIFGKDEKPEDEKKPAKFVEEKKVEAPAKKFK